MCGQVDRKKETLFFPPPLSRRGGNGGWFVWLRGFRVRFEVRVRLGVEWNYGEVVGDDTLIDESDGALW